MPSTKIRIPTLALALAAALAFAGCGADHAGDHGSGSSSTTTATTASDAATVDAAFVAQMIPHHEMALEMARLASTRAQHVRLRTLSVEITDAQSSEISRLTAIAERFGVAPATDGDHGAGHGAHGGGAHGTAGTATAAAGRVLGLAPAEMGMTMDMPALRTARAFDRAFIDAMIPHHQGAIRMARAQLAKGEDPELRRLARGIVRAQAREIQTMNAWRKAWYGGPSPAGGAPAA